MKKLLILIVLIISTITALAAERSNHWPHVRKEFLKLHPVCEVCGTQKSLQVHHVLMFSKHPEMELDPNNLITLCTSKYAGFNDHIVTGHGSNFKWENPWVREDAKILHDMILKYKGYTVIPEEIQQYILYIKKTVKEYNKDNTYKRPPFILVK